MQYKTKQLVAIQPQCDDVPEQVSAPVKPKKPKKKKKDKKKGGK